jgi:phosphomannomutase
MASIYKAYDVRGLYPNEINPEAATTIGRQCAYIFDSGKIVIGRDGRHGGAELRQAFTSGLMNESRKAGKSFELLDVDMTTSPMFYFLVNHYAASGGAMITASHNPKEYNGIKAVGKGAVPISGTEIEAITLN